MLIGLNCSGGRRIPRRPSTRARSAGVQPAASCEEAAAASLNGGLRHLASRAHTAGGDTPLRLPLSRSLSTRSTCGHGPIAAVCSTGPASSLRRSRQVAARDPSEDALDESALATTALKGVEISYAEPEMGDAVRNDSRRQRAGLCRPRARSAGALQLGDPWN